DTRVIDGRPALLFGPFAGFTTRFLKSSSLFDLINSIRSHNLKPMMEVAKEHWALTRYLIKEAISSGDQRLEQLRTFMPSVKAGEWHLRPAGQRVQIIKLDEKGEARQRLEELIPSYGHSLDDDLDLVHAVRRYTLETLDLDDRKPAALPEEDGYLKTGS
ncbi:MAG: malate:quinone oxidoreductase, partial [Candidatus Thiodiazotropha taylori]